MWMAISRGLIVGLSFILQILLSLFVYMYLGNHIPVINVIYSIFSILMVLWLIRSSKNLSFNLMWIIVFLLFPIVGPLLYIIIHRNLASSKILKKIKKSINESSKYLQQEKGVKSKIEKDNYNILKYISNHAGFPVSNNNDLTYYPLGEKAYKDMLIELKSAEKFIFMEYFIVNKGEMWDGILEILEQKAQEGVDVRVMYDDMGSIAMLPSNYPKVLEKKGIKCESFNRVMPFLGVIMNNRDHRKILVIDGKVAFTGGINISDEYINKTHPHGHWKDNAIRIKGEAVWNFTVMFLSMWNSYRNEDKNYEKFKYKFKDEYKSEGFVVPYGDSPLDDEITGENVYLNIISRSKKYVYIFTPYLIIDTDMINNLILAAKRGVDVRIVVPGIADKKIVYDLTSSYFEDLIKGGVKIYKYTPGFVHSKVFVSDDDIATVGTINMDYRSLYLHFECGVFIQNEKVVNEVKKDLEESIKVSELVTEEKAKSKFFKSLWQSILRLLAPLF